MTAIFQRNVSQSKTVRSDVIGIARLFIRRLFLVRPCEKRTLQVLERVPLTAHNSVALLRFEKDTLVLGVTPRSITVLARRTTREPPGNGSVKEE